MNPLSKVTQHMPPLKRALIRITCLLVISLVSLFHQASKMIAWLTAPLMQYNASPMIYTHMLDGFTLQISATFWASLIICIPYMEWEIWRFISPGLLQREKKNTLPFLVLSPLLFLSGITFAYHMVIPHVWKFLIHFTAHALAPLHVNFMPHISHYTHFVLKFLFAFGICFQLPIIMLLLARAGFVGLSFFQEKRRFFVVGIFILSALLTPPDVLSQLLLALPLWTLYEGTVLWLKLGKKRKYNA